jgi:conjugative relaxase-like TrwC/TraI family protein
MMGAESVAYHRATVLERADDFPGMALAYYASRGETPLVWGGAGSVSLGVSGPVSPEAYEAVFGPGGARRPGCSEGLVKTRRPGMELVISAHKSVAELGVIGRAEDMHAIMDAERDATLAYLDRVTRQMGGRRGRAAAATQTGGLIYAHTRHATSRAGDPCPHDHVLLANLVEMLDEAGGWKAADTTLWREHLHAATMTGRVASARAAVELGYGIEADPGPSGRLGHWRIAGIPDEVLALHSKRAAEIEAECQRRGDTSYRARGVAARTTRSAKEHEAVRELVGRWRGELEAAGWPFERLAASVEAARGDSPPMTLKRARRILSEVLGDDSDLARRKIFSRRHVIVALAPQLYGQDPALLDAFVARALADPEVVPIVGVKGARERVHSLASVLAREAAIAESLERQLSRSDAPAVGPAEVEAAIAAAEESLGARLSEEQHSAAVGICTSARGAELIEGVAGAGKTTMLRVVAAAFTAAGCQVLGTGTSGQAARTLSTEANISESRTLASLIWRLDRHQLSLSERSAAILDEVGMTDDVDLVRLTAHVEAACAKLILLGDHRQIGPVGPGGALGALVSRHPAAVHHLMENRRQHDPEERKALAALRGGEVAEAISFYLGRDRIHAEGDRRNTLQAAVDAWSADVAGGHDAGLYAWRRASVAELNALARSWMESTGACRAPNSSAPVATPTGLVTRWSHSPPARAALSSPPSGPSCEPSISPPERWISARTTAETSGSPGSRPARSVSATDTRQPFTVATRCDGDPSPPLCRRRGSRARLCGHEPRSRILTRMGGCRRPRPSRRGREAGLVDHANSDLGPRQRIARSREAHRRRRRRPGGRGEVPDRRHSPGANQDHCQGHRQEPAGRSCPGSGGGQSRLAEGPTGEGRPRHRIGRL